MALNSISMKLFIYLLNSSKKFLQNISNKYFYVSIVIIIESFSSLRPLASDFS